MDHPAPTIPDGVLLRRFAATADEQAFALLVERHRRLVSGVCRRITGDDHDAEDAAQAVFLVLAVKAGRLTDAACVAAWLHRVARHVALRARASAAARRRRHGALTADPPAPEPAEDRIDEVLAGLGERDRAPLLLHYVDGLDCAAIGQRLGITAEAAAMRLSRGRARLRRRLGQAGALLVAGGLAGTAAGADAAAVSAAAAGIAGGAAVDASAAVALARQALAALAAARAAVAAAWLAAALVAGAAAIGGWHASAADAPPAAASLDDDAKAALTAARMDAIARGLAAVGAHDGGAAHLLQRDAHLGGVFEFSSAGGPLPTPALAARADNRFLTAAEIALPHVFGRPWDRADGIASDDPDRDVTLADLDVARTFVDERGVRRSSSITLLALSGILPADDPATGLDEATRAYCTDRDPARPWNDAWGNPIVVAWGIFQPSGAFDERDPSGWGDPTANVAGQRCSEALRRYQYNRCVYVALASAGPLAYELRPDQPPGPVAAAQWADPALEAWTARILPQVWREAASVCAAGDWRGGGFTDPPWRGVRARTRSVDGTTLRCQLSAPYVLR